MNPTVLEGFMQTKERLLQLAISLKQAQADQAKEWELKKLTGAEKNEQVLVCLGLDYWVQVGFQESQAILERKLERIHQSIVLLENYTKQTQDNLPAMKLIDKETVDIQEPVDDVELAIDAGRIPHKAASIQPLENTQKSNLNNLEKTADLTKLNALYEQFLAEEESDQHNHFNLEQKLQADERDLLNAEYGEAEALDDPNFLRDLQKDVHKAYLQKRFQRRNDKTTTTNLSDRRVRFTLPETSETETTGEIPSLSEEKWLRELNEELKASLDLSETHADEISQDEYENEFADDD